MSVRQNAVRLVGKPAVGLQNFKRRSTMRFMVIVKASKDTEAGVMPSTELLTAMGKFNEEMVKAGVMQAGEGLHPPSMGARVSFPGGKPVVTDGPFAEAKEVLGGYWMIQVKSKEEAIEWAKRCPGSDTDVVEVRQVHEMADFPADVQKAAAKFPE